jgi:hypothetical protein
MVGGPLPAGDYMVTLCDYHLIRANLGIVDFTDCPECTFEFMPPNGLPTPEPKSE